MREIACLSREQHPRQRSAAFSRALASMVPLAEQSLNPYEEQRAQRIARNNRVLGKCLLASSEVLCSPVALTVYAAETQLSCTYSVILHLIVLGFCLGLKHRSLQFDMCLWQNVSAEEMGVLRQASLFEAGMKARKHASTNVMRGTKKV